MYEDLIEPLKMCFNGSYLKFGDDNEKKLIDKFGISAYKTIDCLREDVFKSDAPNLFDLWDLDNKVKKATEDFLKLHPDACKEVVDILVRDYVYNVTMH